IKQWEDAFKSLADKVSNLASDHAQAHSDVVALKANLADAQARHFAAQIELLKQQVALAEANENFLKDPATKDKLLDDINTGLASWKSARDQLVALTAGPVSDKDKAAIGDSLEAVKVKINQIQTQLEYLDQLKTVLIEAFLAQPAKPPPRQVSAGRRLE